MFRNKTLMITGGTGSFGNSITIAEPTMTRFIMSLDEAVDLVLFAFENGASGDILVQKAPACTIEVLPQIVRIVQKRTLAGNIGVLSGVAQREPHNSSF